MKARSPPSLGHIALYSCIVMGCARSAMYKVPGGEMGPRSAQSLYLVVFILLFANSCLGAQMRDLVDNRLVCHNINI